MKKEKEIRGISYRATGDTSDKYIPADTSAVPNR